MQVKLFLSLLIWTADSTQFLSENRLHGCQIFGRFRFGSDILYPKLSLFLVDSYIEHIGPWFY